ncbi:Serine/threonine protein kinase [Giardia duodenalis]|uniref:Serine/threonine protein kinase n=1 Tax=Giardia intestinalis TaxID=5741 RepID=V6TJY0_GIAIN|nr:Serine/threonine protein kinase [Giardia intestinalis]
MDNKKLNKNPMPSGAFSFSQKSEINEHEYPQDKITHYIFGQCIGRGSFGSVYYCLHRESRNEFAAKIMSKRYLSKRFFIREFNTQGSEPLSGSDDAGQARAGASNQDTILSYLDLAYQEIEVMKTFRHPCLLRLYEVIQSTELDKLLMIMDLAEGPISSVAPNASHVNSNVVGMLRCIYNSTDLDNLLEYSSLCCTPMSLSFLRKAILHITLGLYALHSKDYVHADIKAANVLRLANGNFVLGDFSLTNHVSVTRTMSTVVSAAYASPDNRGLTKENDVWAFGVTLFMLLFGRHPASLCLHILVSKLPPPEDGGIIISPNPLKRLNHWSDVLREAPDALTNILNVNTASPHATVIQIIVGCLELDYKKRFTIPMIYDLIIGDHIKNTCYRVTNKFTLRLMLNFYKIQSSIILGSGLPPHLTDPSITSRFKVDIWRNAMQRHQFYKAGEDLELDLSLSLTQMILKKNYATFLTDMVSTMDPSNEHSASFLISLALMGTDGDLDVYFYSKFIRLFLWGVSSKRTMDTYWSDIAYLLYNNMNYKRLHTSRTLKELNFPSIHSTDSEDSEEQHVMLLGKLEQELAPEICNLDMGCSPLFEFEQRNHYFVKDMFWNFPLNASFARTRILLMDQGLRPPQLIFYEMCMLKHDLSKSHGLATSLYASKSDKKGNSSDPQARFRSACASVVKRLTANDSSATSFLTGANYGSNALNTEGGKGVDAMHFVEEDAYGMKGYDGGNLLSSTLGVMSGTGEPHCHGPAASAIKGAPSALGDGASSASALAEDLFEEEIDLAKLSSLFSKQYISEQDIAGTGLYVDNFSFGSGEKASKNKVCVVAGGKADPSATALFMKDLFNLDSRKDQNNMLGLGSFSLSTLQHRKASPAKKKTLHVNSTGQRKEGTSQADAYTPSDTTDKKQLLSDSSSDDGDIVAVAASDSDDMDRAFGLEEEAAKKSGTSTGSDISDDDSDIEFVGSNSDNMDAAFGLISSSYESDVQKIMDMTDSSSEGDDYSDGYSSDGDIVAIGSDSEEMDAAFGLEKEPVKRESKQLSAPVSKPQPEARGSFDSLMVPETVSGEKRMEKPKPKMTLIAQSFDAFDEALEDKYMESLPDDEKQLYSVGGPLSYPLIGTGTVLPPNNDEGIQEVPLRAQGAENTFSFGSFASLRDSAMQLFSKRPLSDQQAQDAHSDAIETIGEDSTLILEPLVGVDRQKGGTLHNSFTSEGRAGNHIDSVSLKDPTYELKDKDTSPLTCMSVGKLDMGLDIDDEESNVFSQPFQMLSLTVDKSVKILDAVSVMDPLTSQIHDTQASSQEAFALDINPEDSEGIDRGINIGFAQNLPEDAGALTNQDDNFDCLHLSFHNDNIEYPHSDSHLSSREHHDDIIANANISNSSGEYDQSLRVGHVAHMTISQDSDEKVNAYLKDSEMHIPEEHMALLMTRTVILLIYSTWAVLQRFGHRYSKSMSLADAYSKFHILVDQVLSEGTHLYGKWREYKDKAQASKSTDEEVDPRVRMLLKYGTDKAHPYALTRTLATNILSVGRAYIQALCEELGTPTSFDDDWVSWPLLVNDCTQLHEVDLDGFLRFTPDNYKTYLQNKLTGSVRNSSFSQLTDASAFDQQNSSFSGSMEFFDNPMLPLENNALAYDVHFGKSSVMATLPSISFSKNQTATGLLSRGPSALPPGRNSVSGSRSVSTNLSVHDKLACSLLHPQIVTDHSVIFQSHSNNLNNNELMKRKCASCSDFSLMADAAHSTEALLHASSVPLTKLNGFQDLLDPPSDDLASDSNVNAIEPHVSQVNRVSLGADESYAKTAEGSFIEQNVPATIDYCTTTSADSSLPHSLRSRSTFCGLSLCTERLRLIENSANFDVPLTFQSRSVSLRHKARAPHKMSRLSLHTHQRHHYGIRPIVEIVKTPSIMDSSISTSPTNVSLTEEQNVGKEKGDDGLFELSAQSSSLETDNLKIELITNDVVDLITPLKVSSGQVRSSSQEKCTRDSPLENSDSNRLALRPVSQNLHASNAHSTTDNIPLLSLSDKQQRLENLISHSIHPFLVSSWKLTKQRLTLNASGLNPNKGWVILSIIDVAHFLQGIAKIINVRSTTSSYGTDAPQVRLYCNENIVYEPRSLQNTIAHSRLPKTIRETVKLRQNVHDLWVNIGLDAAERSPLVGIRHSTKERQGYIIRRSTQHHNDEINKYEGDLDVTRAQVCSRKANGKVELRLKSLFDLLEIKNKDVFNADNAPATMNVGGKEIYGNDCSDFKQSGHSSSDDGYNIPSGYKILNTCMPAMGDMGKPVSIYRFSRNAPTGDYFTFLYANSVEGNRADFKDSLVPGDQNYLANWLIETDKIERPQAQMDEVIVQTQDSVKIKPLQIDSDAKVMPSILSTAAISINSQANLKRMGSSNISHSVLRRKSVSAANMFALYPRSAIGHMSEPSPPAPVEQPFEDVSTPSVKLDDYQIAAVNEENSIEGLSTFQIEHVTSNMDMSSEQQTGTNDLNGYDFQLASSEMDSKALTDVHCFTISTLVSQPSLPAPLITGQDNNSEPEHPNDAEKRPLAMKSCTTGIRPLFPTITRQDYEAMENAQRQACTEGFADTGGNSTLQALCIDTGVYVNRMSFEEHVFMPHIFLEILLDLVVNARQYSKPSIVRAALFNCQESLYLVVNDCGIGLPKQCWQHAFFHQQELADISQCLGSGLARAILITRAYGGIINVSSCKNGGTRLILKIPLPKESTFIDA